MGVRGLGGLPQRGNGLHLRIVADLSELEEYWPWRWDWSPRSLSANTRELGQNLDGHGTGNDFIAAGLRTGLPLGLLDVQAAWTQNLKPSARMWQ